MAYKLTHADSDVEITANADDVATYESQGWETKPNVKSPTEDDDK
jgi:hypothetical protein